MVLAIFTSLTLVSVTMAFKILNPPGCGIETVPAHAEMKQKPNTNPAYAARTRRNYQPSSKTTKQQQCW
jgi:hypothetical protein